MELMDFGAIARSGMAQVPDYAEQEAQAQQRQLQQSQQRLAQMAFQQKQAKEQREIDTETGYQNDLGGYLKTGNPQDLIRLAAKYPDKSEGIKRAFDAQDKVVKDADLRQAVSILGYVKNGKPELAAASLEDRITKSRAAGEPDDPQDAAILEALKSGDPAQIREAEGLISYHVASITGVDNFSKTLSDLNPKNKQSPFMLEYNDRVAQFGKANADKWAAIQDEKFIPVDGVGVFKGSDLIGEGGGQSSSGGAVAPNATAPTDVVQNGRSVIEQIFPGISVTDNVRDPNSSLGRANPNSFHVKTGGAVDVKPIPGMTFPQFVGQIKSAGYKIAEAKNEVGAGRSKHATGDHWHVVIAKGPGIPARVRSIQEARALAKGTVFFTPDGVRKIR